MNETRKVLKAFNLKSLLKKLLCLHSQTFQKSLIERYKNRIALLESIEKITDLYSFKSLHFEKLKGIRTGQSSIRLNDQYRLIIEQLNEEEIKILINPSC